MAVSVDCTITALEVVDKVLYFLISLLSIRYSLCTTSRLQTFFSIVYPLYHLISWSFPRTLSITKEQPAGPGQLSLNISLLSVEILFLSLRFIGSVHYSVTDFKANNIRRQYCVMESRETESTIAQESSSF